MFLISIQDVKGLLLGLFPLSLFFAWRFYTLYNGAGEFPVVINMDSLKHVIRAAFLTSTGIESVNVNYLVLPQGVDPYHYFEAWLIGLLGKGLSENFWVAEQLYAYPMILTIIVMGVWALVNRWKPAFYVYVLCPSAVIFSGLYFAPIEKFPFFSYTAGFSMNAFDEWKGFVLSITYMVVVLFFNLFFATQKKSFAILLLLLLPLVSITLAPTILSIVFLLVFLGAAFNNKIQADFKFSDLLYPITIAIYIFAFYKLFESPQPYIIKPNPTGTVAQLASLSALKSKVIIVVEKALQGFILFSPFVAVAIALLYKEYHKNRQKLLNSSQWQIAIVLAVVVAVSVFFWQLFFGSFGSGQFLFYTAMPFVNVLFFLVLVYATNHSQPVLYRIVGGLLICCCMLGFAYRSYEIHAKGKAIWFDKYSNEYLSKVRKELSLLDKRVGVKFDPKSAFVKYNDTHHLFVPFLLGHFNDSYMFSYTLAEMYFEDDFPTKEARMLIPKAPFVVYCNELASAKNFTTKEDALLKLVKDKRVTFAVTTSDSSIPEWLSEYVGKEITDERAKERMYVFK